MTYGIRLPYYLADDPVWQDLASSMDTVLGEFVQTPAQKLADIRNVNNFHPDAVAAKGLVEGQSDLTKLLDGTDRSYNGELWNNPTWRTQSAAMLGVNYYNTYTLNPITYDQFIKLVVQYYPEQGTNSWITFLGFATDSLITVNYLWTNDYVNFLPAGDPGIGTPVYQGGTWYPTSKVDVIVTVGEGAAAQIDSADFLNLLRFVAPINIVFRSVVVQTSAYMQLYLSIASDFTESWRPTETTFLSFGMASDFTDDFSH